MKRSVKQKKLIDDPDLSGEEFFFCNEVNRILADLFKVLIFFSFVLRQKKE